MLRHVLCWLVFGLVLRVWCDMRARDSLKQAEQLQRRHQTDRTYREELLASEHAHSWRWNDSASQFFVLGKKKGRDFGVYAWAFAVNGHRLSVPSAGYFRLMPGPADVPAAPGAGALLCHSLFLSNCVRGYRGSSVSSNDGGEGDGDGVYKRLRGMKINRIAGVRQVLSTKDGLCHTMKHSGLPESVLRSFSFPCWVLPSDTSRLVAHLAVSTRGVHGGAFNGSSEVASYIVKPSRGSQGQGIRVLSASALAARVLAPPVLRSIRTPLVVQPYLRSPMLHTGRKWDLRTYVLATSVLPMRVYVFAEAIVRYAASAQYSPASTDDSSVLTNTHVGKQILRQGVGSITTSLAELCEDAPIFTREGSSTSACRASLMDGIRKSISHTMLASEPSLDLYYREHWGSRPRRRPDVGVGEGVPRAYSNTESASMRDEGEGISLFSKAARFRCVECYHLLGVDLIADAKGTFRVIEINVSPDLSLSTLGANGADGSMAYDHTKLAAAFNTVQLVYSRKAAAGRLELILQRNAAAILRLDLLSGGGGQPSSASSAARVPVLQTDVIEYLLDMVRERQAAGCFTAVYPSIRHFAEHSQLLENMARTHENRTAARHVRRRQQLHALLGIVLSDLEDGNSSRFRDRCRHMLDTVPRVQEGSWARRTHIFREIWDIVN